MAKFTEEQKKEILKIIRDNSIVLSDLKPLEDENGDVWVFGTKVGVDGEESVRINISEFKGVKGEDGKTRQEVSVYKESETQPNTPEEKVPQPEGWLLEQGLDGTWWVSRATFEINADGSYEMVRSWSPPVRVSALDGSTIVGNYRYCSSYSPTSAPEMEDREDITSPGPGWKLSYELVSGVPDMDASDINKPAQYNVHLDENPVYLWRTEAGIVDGRHMVSPWSDPILISGYGGRNPKPPVLTPIVNLSSNLDFMMCDPDTFKPKSNQEIVITAKPQNFKDVLMEADVVFKMISYDVSGSGLDSVILKSDVTTPDEPITILTDADWKAEYAKVDIICTITSGGFERSASITILRFSVPRDGVGAIFGYLSPSSRNIMADEQGVPSDEYKYFRSQFTLFDNGVVVLDSGIDNPDVEFEFKKATLGFEVAVIENGKWKSSTNGILENEPVESGEGDGMLKIINLPPGSDYMSIRVIAIYKGFRISSSFEVIKNKENSKPELPAFPDTEVKQYINALTKKHTKPKFTKIDANFIKTDEYQSDDFVPNKILHGSYITWTPSDLEWHKKPRSVDEVWAYQWHSERVKTNGVWGAFDDPILRNNFSKSPEVPDTPAFSIFLENPTEIFHGRSGDTSTSYIRAFYDSVPEYPTRIQVGDAVGMIRGSYDMFDFSINNSNWSVSFTLNKSVDTYTNGKIPINTTVDGREYTLHFQYIIFPFISGGGKDVPLLMISSDSYFMLTDSNNKAKPGQEVTIASKSINISGSVNFSAIAYPGGSSVNLHGNYNTRILKSEDWSDSTEKVVITVSMPGTSLKDVTTIYRHQDTADAISGHLTNGYITINPDSSGEVTFFDYAKGIFKVKRGGEFITRDVQFSVVEQVSGCTVSIDSNGAYKVVSLSVDSALVTLRAKYGSSNIDLDLTIIKGSLPPIVDGNAYLKLTSTHQTINRDLTDINPPYKDSTPETIKVYGIHSNMTNLTWAFQVDGVDDFSETLPAGITKSMDGDDTLIIKTAELKGVPNTLSIRFGGITTNGIEIFEMLSISILAFARSGVPGKTPITKEWEEGTTHYNNLKYVDFIYYRGSNNPKKNGWFKLVDSVTQLDAPATPYVKDEELIIRPQYEKIEDFGTKAFEVVIAEEGNLAGFVFKNNKLFSQNIKTVDTEDKANIMLDGINGELRALKVVVEGEVRATSGEIGSFTIDDNGYLIGYNNMKNATVGLNANSSNDSLAFWAGGSLNEVLEYKANHENPNPNFRGVDNVAYISHDGEAFFSKAKIEGNITAKEGYIGNFKIIGGSLVGYNDVNGKDVATVGLYAKGSGNDYAFMAGYNSNLYTKIYHDGRIEAAGATISGDITSRSLITNPGGSNYISLNETIDGVSDNLLKFRHLNGNIAAEFGVINGETAMIWYDKDGNEVWRAGETGITYVKVVETPARFTPIHMRFMSTLDMQTNLTPSDDNYIKNELQGVLCNTSNSAGAAVGINGGSTYYQYSASHVGGEYDPEDKAKEGVYRNNSLSSGTIQDGWYIVKSRINTTPYNLNINVPIDLHRFVSGKQVDTYNTVIMFTKPTNQCSYSYPND